jgi:hypothetical protein
MTLLNRFAFLALLTSLITACDTLYIAQPVQPAPMPVYVPSYNQPMPQPAPVSPYPSPAQPSQPPTPIQPPSPLPPSVPSKVAPSPVTVPAPRAVVVPAQPVSGDDSNSNVIPVRAPGSISELPDPS